MVRIYTIYIACYQSIGFSEEEQTAVWKVVASVVHLCNADIQSSGDGESSKVEDMIQLEQVAKLIETSPDSIAEVLTHRHVATRGEAIRTTINQAKAVYARDALAKVLSYLFIHKKFTEIL